MVVIKICGGFSWVVFFIYHIFVLIHLTTSGCHSFIFIVMIIVPSIH